MAVKSAERVFIIFELLERYPGGLTNKEISSILEFAPSSTLALLQTMTEYGYLSVDEQKRYYLGGRLIALGSLVSSRMDIHKITTPYLKELMRTVDETCFVGVLSDKEVMYVAKENCERTITTNAYIGSRKPVYCTGLGKAFLAFLPKEESERLLEGMDLVPFTEHTITDRETLLKQIEEFRVQGYVIDDQEIEEGLWCMAVPIYGADRHMEAALSVSGLKKRMLEKKGTLISEMTRMAHRISRELGYH